MSKFNIDRRLFVENFLQPINKVSEQCVIELDNDIARVVVSDSNTTMILFGETKVDYTDTPARLNIGDVLKLLKAIECIDQDEASFSIENNNIKYSSPGLKFKYHILDDNIIAKPTINVEKLSQIDISTSFIIPKSTLRDILKSSSFTSDSNKIYFYTRDDKVICELNDKTMPNLDSVEMVASESFSGEPIKQELPLRLDWFRLFTSVNFENVSVRYNDDNKIVIFQIENENTTLKYIVSGLTK